VIFELSVAIGMLSTFKRELQPRGSSRKKLVFMCLVRGVILVVLVKIDIWNTFEMIVLEQWCGTHWGCKRFVPKIEWANKLCGDCIIKSFCLRIKRQVAL
jgi:hypothetical protein